MSATESEPAAVPPKRRWYQFSLRTLLLLPVLLALVLSAVYSWPIVHRRYVLWRLQDYADKDLTKLPNEQRERVNGWLRFLLAESPVEFNGTSIYPRDNRLLHISDSAEIGRRIFVIETEMDNLPDLFGEFCVLHTLDSSGRLLRSRRLIAFAAFQSATIGLSQRGYESLTIVGTDIRQIYRLTDDSVESLRSEDRNGKSVLGLRSTFEETETPPDWSDWPWLLDSPEELQQLRGLAAFFSVRDKTKPIDDRVRQRLKELTNSPDPWISEEAKLALEEAKK
jgi:hypothetical protein